MSDDRVHSFRGRFEDGKIVFDTGNMPVVFQDQRGEDPIWCLSNYYPAVVNFAGTEWPSIGHCWVEATLKGWPPAPPFRVLSGRPMITSMMDDLRLLVRPNSVWQMQASERMKEMLIAKFTAHIELRDQLVRTNERMIIYENRKDGFWGIGESGNGKNTLGRLLCLVRGFLIASPINPVEKT
jgi:hypothetical protein